MRRVLLAEDSLLWSGAHSGADPKQVALLPGSLHPSMSVGLGVFVVGHVLGTVLFGITLLRSTRVPAWAAWAVAISQPLHFIAAVIVGSPRMDMIGWSLTGVGLAVVARALLADDALAARKPIPA